jgi:hypothetical protein
MRLGRTALIVTLIAAPVWVATPHATAAPMTGVEFIDVSRIFDSAITPADLPAGTHTISLLQAPPTGTTQALVQLTLVAPNSAATGLLMAHSCGVPADPLTDVVLPIQGGTSNRVVINQAYVPVVAGAFCVTTTVATTRFIVDLEAWVTSGSGAAYVDLPYSYVTTVVGPVTDAQINLSAYGVPSDAAGVAVWLDTLSTTAGFATVYPCGQPRPLRSQAIWSADEFSSNLVAGVAISPAGLCIYISDGASVDISIDGYYKVGATPTSTSPPQIRYTQGRAPGFVGTSPTRLFDTRSSGAPIAAGQVYRLDLSSTVPLETTAVVMNVTATGPTGSGFVTAYPCDGEQPDTSSLNFEAGQTVPNLVTVDAGFTLEVCFFVSKSTHLLADLAGYYVIGGGDGFTPSSPVRMFDTRNTTKIARGSVFEFDLSSFVASDASAAVFNLTATDVDGPGYVTAYPCGQTPPVASNLNVVRGQTVPNLVTVALPSNKHVCFFTLPGANLVADLAGWYAPSSTSGFISVFPTRWADTRDDSDLPVPTGLVLSIDFGLDFPDATAMVFNATVTEPQAAGYLTAYPCAPDPPNASNVNFVADQSVPNMVISAIASSGEVCFYNSAPLQWIVDVSGYFTDALLFFGYFPIGTDNQ